MSASVDQAIAEYCDKLAKLQTAFFEQSTHSTQLLVQLVLAKIDDIGKPFACGCLPPVLIFLQVLPFSFPRCLTVKMHGGAATNFVFPGLGRL